MPSDPLAHVESAMLVRCRATTSGAAVVAILRAQQLVRPLNAADREHLAAYAADLLVELCKDAPPA